MDCPSQNGRSLRASSSGCPLPPMGYIQTFITAELSSHQMAMGNILNSHCFICFSLGNQRKGKLCLGRCGRLTGKQEVLLGPSHCEIFVIPAAGRKGRNQDRKSTPFSKSTLRWQGPGQDGKCASVSVRGLLNQQRNTLDLC